MEHSRTASYLLEGWEGVLGTAEHQARGCGTQQNTKRGGVGHSRTPSEGVWDTAVHQAICWRGGRGWNTAEHQARGSSGTQQNSKRGGVGHSRTPSEGVWDTAEHQVRGCGTQQNTKLSAIHPVNMNPEQNVNRGHKNN